MPDRAMRKLGNIQTRPKHTHRPEEECDEDCPLYKSIEHSYAHCPIVEF